jgi:hypothetical protein
MALLSVPEVLQGYVDRGLLRDFEASGVRASGGEFAFRWLNHVPMRLQWKAGGRTITFKDVVPKVPAKSVMYRELREFLKERTSDSLPEHRRVDPAEFELLCQNRLGNVSIGLRVTGGAEEPAVRKLMLVIHEAFLFLHDRWPDYMHEKFGASLE